jgi:hypothetical protein
MQSADVRLPYGLFSVAFIISTLDTICAFSGKVVMTLNSLFDRARQLLSLVAHRSTPRLEISLRHPSTECSPPRSSSTANFHAGPPHLSSGYQPEVRENMPVEKLRRLCKTIAEEDDPETLTRLIAELTKHLKQDQDAIKAKIAQFNPPGRR